MTQALFINAKEVCARRGISRTTLYELVARGELPGPYHFGRSARWSVAELEANELAIGGVRQRSA